MPGVAVSRARSKPTIGLLKFPVASERSVTPGRSVTSGFTLPVQVVVPWSPRSHSQQPMRVVFGRHGLARGADVFPFKEELNDFLLPRLSHK